MIIIGYIKVNGKYTLVKSYSWNEFKNRKMAKIATVHVLKTWPIYFRALQQSRKRFEIRKNDRDFKVGDFLVLKEFDPKTKEYSGYDLKVKVTYILKGEEWGIKEGYIAMSIA